MKNNKSLEMKIYEFLGIRTFRKIVFKAAYYFSYVIRPKMTKEERFNFIYRRPSNYIMKRGNGVQDLKDFKKELAFNAQVHICGMLIFIPVLLHVIMNGFTVFSIGRFIFESLVFLLNSYCVMLQRYNYIRINKVIKKFNIREESKKEEQKEEKSKKKTNLNRKKTNRELLEELRKQRRQVSILVAQYSDKITYDMLKEVESNIENMYVRVYDGNYTRKLK